MAEWFHQQASSGSLVLAVPVALIAGLVSFFSPCVIPLLPGYLSYATGLTGADLASGAAGERRGRMLLGSVLFVLGFSVVFVALGTAVGRARCLAGHLATDALSLVLGVLTILLGLAFAGFIPLLQREWRIHAVPAVGLAAAPAPRLPVRPRLDALHRPHAGRDHHALDQRGDRRRAVRCCPRVYALGLGIPFIVAGLAYRRALGAFGFVRRHQVWVTRLGGLMLVAVGVLLVTGWWDQAVTWIQIHLVSSTETSL